MPTALIDGRRMYFEVHGEGEPLLSISGFGLTTGHGFANQPANLRDRFRIVVFDHRGLGQSDDDGTHPSTMLYARDAARLLAHLDLKRVHLLGAGGLGACIAQHLAALRPNLVHDLVLSAGWIAPEPYHHTQQKLMMILRSLNETTAYTLFGALVGTRPEHFSDDIIEGRNRTASAQEGTWKDRRDAHLKLMQANYEHDATGVLGQIKCPTLVTCGEYDQLGGPRLGRALANAITGSEFELVRDVGHVFSVNPRAQEAYGKMVEAFFNRHPL